MKTKGLPPEEEHEIEKKKYRFRIKNLREAIEFLFYEASIQVWRVGDDETSPMMYVDEYCEKVLDEDNKMKEAGKL